MSDGLVTVRDLQGSIEKKETMMAGHGGHPAEVTSKQHAMVRDQPKRGQPILNVYDPEDWELMRSLPTGSLICPIGDCRADFNRPSVNRHGTRWLTNRAGHGCAHVVARPQLAGGGLMSAQHRWLEHRLARMCRAMGLTAITEHADTNSDVFVPAQLGCEIAFSLEVQRWNTDFEQRMRQRLEKGAQTVWFITEDAKGSAVDRALFTLPAVRLQIVDSRDHSRRLQPWSDPDLLNPHARLLVYGTVAQLRHGVLVTGKMDGYRFLQEVLNGKRQWYPPRTVKRSRGNLKPEVSPNGVWAIPDEIDQANAQVERPTTPHITTVPSSPNSAPVLMSDDQEPIASYDSTDSENGELMPSVERAVTCSVVGEGSREISGFTPVTGLTDLEHEKSSLDSAPPTLPTTAPRPWWARLVAWLNK